MTTKAKSRNEANPCGYGISRIKAVIVRMVLWGLIPFGLSVWLIRHGGLQDD